MPGLPIEGPSDAETSFDAAFAAAASAGGEIPAPADAPAGAAAEAPAPAAPADGEAAPAVPEGAAPAAEPAPAGDPAAPAPAETPAAEPAPAAPSAEDILNKLAEKLNAPAPAAEPASAPAPANPAVEAPLYTAEEMGILQDYEKNWPDVAAAETLRQRAVVHDMLKYVFSEVQAYVGPTIDQLRVIQNNLHTGELKSLVPEYDTGLEEKVLSWVDGQPSYLQGAMKQVMQTGTSEEVADLIGRYRAATGAVPAAPAAAAPKATPQAELSEAAKQAAASLAPVSGERSAVPQGEPQDFDSAFAQYAASMPGLNR